ncbi:hypothetical protein N658DRAFT_17816 [Parathielavia hyrcaniae]|uniref:Uncharacterized protein n=1 Tax=Parathielavia hyrcaniae TaxID=113614 RepID=A0AAN6QA56_9PEZI|nr:hypothetical protein N658DRAFT_17816 [Parathielavia hyrcaniae]
MTTASVGLRRATQRPLPSAIPGCASKSPAHSLTPLCVDVPQEADPRRWSEKVQKLQGGCSATSDAAPLTAQAGFRSGTWSQAGPNFQGIEEHADGEPDAGLGYRKLWVWWCPARAGWHLGHLKDMYCTVAANRKCGRRRVRSTGALGRLPRGILCSTTWLRCPSKAVPGCCCS